MTALLLLLASLGIWLLYKFGDETLWAVPAFLHFTIAIIAIVGHLTIRTELIQLLTFPYIGASLGSVLDLFGRDSSNCSWADLDGGQGCQSHGYHLLQCLFCDMVILARSLQCWPLIQRHSRFYLLWLHNLREDQVWKSTKDDYERREARKPSDTSGLAAA
jgi:hypothetical protein